jgi:hypothetical protein
MYKSAKISKIFVLTLLSYFAIIAAVRRSQITVMDVLGGSTERRRTNKL